MANKAGKPATNESEDFSAYPLQRQSENRGVGKPRRGKGGRKVEAGKTERAKA